MNAPAAIPQYHSPHLRDHQSQPVGETGAQLKFWAGQNQLAGGQNGRLKACSHPFSGEYSEIFTAQKKTL